MNTKAATSPRTEDALPEGHRGKVDSRTQLGNGAMGETESGERAPAESVEPVSEQMLRRQASFYVTATSLYIMYNRVSVELMVAEMTCCQRQSLAKETGRESRDCSA